MATKKGEVKKTSAEEAMRIIAEEQQNRVRACQVEVQAVLQKYNCQVTAEVLLRQGQVIPNVVIVPVQNGNQ